MRRILSIYFLLFFLFLKPVAAQSGPQFETVRIEIWPEYDRTDVLMIYRMELAESEALPAQISLRIPTSAGTPYNVAYQEVDGKLFTLSYTTELQGDWLKITFTTPTAILQVEYYDPGLQKEGTLRSFTYQWPGDVDIANLSVSVQEPVNSSRMKISPAIGSGEMKADGLVYYTTVVGAIDAGTEFNLSLEYDKTDNALSASMLPVQSAEPLQEESPISSDSDNTLVYILGGLGGLMLIGGIIWFFLTREPEDKKYSPKANKDVRHSSTRSKPRSEINAEGDNVYCHQCGRRAERGDVFCRTCGTRLRTE